MGRPDSHVLTGRTMFTAEESARFHLFAVRCGSKRAARKALGCNEAMFDNATGQGRVMPQTRARLVAKLDSLTGVEAVEARVDVLEAQVRSLQMAAPRGIE